MSDYKYDIICDNFIRLYYGRNPVAEFYNKRKMWIIHVNVSEEPRKVQWHQLKVCQSFHEAAEEVLQFIPDHHAQNIRKAV